MTGFDPVYGARPLRRLVQSAIGDQLARALLAGEIADGDTVLVDLDEAADALTRAGPGAQLVTRGLGRSPPTRSGLVEQLVVAVLGQPEVVADPVPQAQQQCAARRRRRRRPPTWPGVRPAALARQAQLDPGRRPVQGASCRSARSTSSSATRSHIRGSRRPSAFSLLMQRLRLGGLAEQEQRPGQRDPRVHEDRTAVRHASRKPLAAAAGSSASSHCSPARRKPPPAASIALRTGHGQLGHLPRRGLHDHRCRRRRIRSRRIPPGSEHVLRTQRYSLDAKPHDSDGL